MDAYSYLDASFSSDSTLAYLGGSNGAVTLVDMRVKSLVASMACQNTRINSVQLLPSDETKLIVSGGGKDGSITIHDVRKRSIKWPVLRTIDEHRKSINAAYASPDGQYLVSVSQDDTVHVMHSFLSDTMKKTVLRHNNQTGRWLSTFRPCFDEKMSSSFMLGSLDQPRVIQIFTASMSSTETVQAALSVTLRGEFLGSVCSRNAFHSSLDVVAGGNSSGRVHIFR